MPDFLTRCFLNVSEREAQWIDHPSSGGRKHASAPGGAIFFFLKTCFCVYGCPFNKVIDSVIVIYSKLRKFFSRFKKNELSVEYVRGSVLELIIQRWIRIHGLCHQRKVFYRIPQSELIVIIISIHWTVSYVPGTWVYICISMLILIRFILFLHFTVEETEAKGS